MLKFNLQFIREVGYQIEPSALGKWRAFISKFFDFFKDYYPFFIIQGNLCYRVVRCCHLGFTVMIQSLERIMSSSVFTTVLSGVTVFVLGQVIVKSAIEPYIAFKEQVGRVSALLLREQEKITNFNHSAELLLELKNASALLLVKYSALPCYLKGTFLGMSILPSKSDVIDAAHHLNLIHSGLAGDERNELYSYISLVGSKLRAPTTYRG